MNVLNDIVHLSKQYLKKKISMEMWQSFTILKIAQIQGDENAEDVARQLAGRQEDENNV